MSLDENTNSGREPFMERDKMRKLFQLALTVMLLPALAFCLAGCVKPPAKVQTLTNPSTLHAVVWASKKTGTYYCSGTYMYGRAEGTYMNQENALDSGYQPALGSYCKGSKSPVAATRNSMQSDYAGDVAEGSQR